MTRKRKLAGAVSREKMLLIYVTDQTMVEGLFCSHKTASKLVVIKGGGGGSVRCKLAAMRNEHLAKVE